MAWGSQDLQKSSCGAHHVWDFALAVALKVHTLASQGMVSACHGLARVVPAAHMKWGFAVAMAAAAAD